MADIRDVQKGVREAVLRGFERKFETQDSGGYYRMEMVASTPDSIVVTIEDRDETYKQTWHVGLVFKEL